MAGQRLFLAAPSAGATSKAAHELKSEASLSVGCTSPGGHGHLAAGMLLEVLEEEMLVQRGERGVWLTSP